MSHFKCSLFAVLLVTFIDNNLSAGYFSSNQEWNEIANQQVSEDMCNSGGRHLASIHTSYQYESVFDECQVSLLLELLIQC